jgi:lipoprotein-anchoring transpeptidase ErfK/SrfK
MAGASLAVALFPPNLLCRNKVVLRDRKPVLRVGLGFVLIVFALAVSHGQAAAQPYPPLVPGDYYQAPPTAYPYPPPRSYATAPVPPANVGGQPNVPATPYGQPAYVYRDAGGAPLRPYDPRYDELADEGPMGPYPSPGGPYYGEQYPRPPGYIGRGPAEPDFTGAIGAPAPGPTTTLAALPPGDRPERGSARDLPPQLHRQLVDYATPEPAGTIIIDTPHTFLYLVLGGGKAIRYGIGVGRAGYTWAGTERISRMTEWPDWLPPKEMIERQPYLPRFMAGGEGNPLGARALYLGNTLYRIHGTNQPSSIGHFVSSGCIRLTNEDIADLYSRVNVGSRVVVLPGSPPAAAGRGPYAR